MKKLFREDALTIAGQSYHLTPVYCATSSPSLYSVAAVVKALDQVTTIVAGAGQDQPLGTMNRLGVLSSSPPSALRVNPVAATMLSSNGGGAYAGHGDDVIEPSSSSPYGDARFSRPSPLSSGLESVVNARVGEALAASSGIFASASGIVAGTSNPGPFRDGGVFVGDDLFRGNARERGM